MTISINNILELFNERFDAQPNLLNKLVKQPQCCIFSGNPF